MMKPIAYANVIPIVMKIWLNEPNFPDIDVGASEIKYDGTAIPEIPSLKSKNT